MAAGPLVGYEVLAQNYYNHIDSDPDWPERETMLDIANKKLAKQVAVLQKNIQTWLDKKYSGELEPINEEEAYLLEGNTPELQTLWPQWMATFLTTVQTRSGKVISIRPEDRKKYK